jgi:cytochrome c2
VAGESIAARCTVCHTTGFGQPAMIGPNLYDIVGAGLGRTQGFSYSVSFQALRAQGAIWTFDRLDAFLASPATAIPGTRMGFAGIENETQRADLLAFLRTLSNNPVPLAPTAGAADATRNGLVPIVFTQEQVDYGRDFYNRECSRCHGANLAGTWFGAERGDAYPLAGTNFQRKWFGAPVGTLFGHMQVVEIPSNYPYQHSGWSQVLYAQLFAYIMQRNGFSPGPTELPTDPAVLATMGYWQ